MIAFDTTFLLDYLDGEAAVREFLESHTAEPLFAPTLSLFEVYRGVARTRGSGGVDELAAMVNWLEPLPTTEAAAREAAVIEAELVAAGRQINLGDVLIAGVCRNVGASVVTRDGHFQHVDGLEVIEY